MNRKLILTSAALASALAMAVSAPAASAATDAVSENWAGYELTNGASDFSAASGSWVQPAARCTPGTPTYSAYWVGLGGGSTTSSALEQTGTQSDCTANGSTQNYAWYELVPAAPVRLDLKVSAGDKMYARVAVSGSTVDLTLKNQTTGATFQKTLHMTNPDTSTAEWVAEAPSACTSSMQNCTPLPLSDFGTVKFTDAYATSDGHTGTIGDPAWNAVAISLAPSSSNVYAGSGFGGYGPTETAGTSSNSAAAQPSSLSSDGTWFTVSYGSDAQSSQPSSYSGGTGSGYGNGYGDPYGGGYGDPYGYGGSYGDPYGYSGGYGYGGGYGVYGAYAGY